MAHRCTLMHLHHLCSLRRQCADVVYSAFNTWRAAWQSASPSCPLELLGYTIAAAGLLRLIHACCSCSSWALHILLSQRKLAVYLTKLSPCSRRVSCQKSFSKSIAVGVS